MKFCSPSFWAPAAAVTRPLERHLAVGGRADQLDRVLVGEFEVDEERGIEHFKHQLRGLERRPDRQRKVQCQHGVLVFEVVVDRLLEFLLFSVGLGEGEEGVLFSDSTLVCAREPSSSRL
jgi:hypothetical protein